jgi:hypothetical protein
MLHSLNACIAGAVYVIDPQEIDVYPVKVP